jgi:hypothetical protein
LFRSDVGNTGYRPGGFGVGDEADDLTAVDGSQPELNLSDLHRAIASDPCGPGPFAIRSKAFGDM